MRADADDPRPDATFFASLGRLKEEVDAALRPIAEPVETRKNTCSAEALLEAIEQDIEAHHVGETAHLVL